jgi:surfeit locus 1 family protein
LPLHLQLGSREFRASGLMTLLAIAGIAVFILLGRWQWHRADQKRAALASFETGATSQIQALGDRPLASIARYSRITVSGRYQGEHQFLLDNIGRDGRAGYEVLTPLTLADGRTLLVNRGWIALRDGGRERLPDIMLPAAGELSVTGRVDELPVAGLSLGHAAPTIGPDWPKLTSFPTSAELGAALGRSVEPRQLLLDAGLPAGYRRDWQPANVGFGPERHVAYAVQWWSLAMLVAVLYVVINLRRI